LTTEKEFIERVRAEAEEFEHRRVKQALRKYGVKRVYDAQIKIVKIVLVLEKYVTHITIKMISEILGRDARLINPILRGLGDKNVLHLKGYGGKRDELLYVVHPAFLLHCFPSRKEKALKALKESMELKE
jgi:valyl-tRNA synthetase